MTRYSLLKAAMFMAALPAWACADAQKRYVGGDISLLPLCEEAGAQYKTHGGQPVADLLPFCKGEGMNAMRVRLFVNPQDYGGADKDPNACQTLEYITPLCKRIHDNGMALILDFMYSDTWADPGKQWTPKQWEGQDDDELCKTVHDYTAECLRKLGEAGVSPEFIQTGNEISYGMLWGPAGAAEKDLKKCYPDGSEANWARFGRLLSSAGSACREVCPEAKIIIHTERAAQPDVQKNFYGQIERLGVDYDIIGISYYPYFHGPLGTLDAAIEEMEADFPRKRIMVVETGYPYAWEVPGSTEKTDYPYSDEGQNRFTADLVSTLEKHKNVDGLFWWWFEYNAFGTSLEKWYNAPLFDSNTGCATSALETLCRFAGDISGIGGASVGACAGGVRWYDTQGLPVREPSQAKGIIVGSDGSKRLR